MFSTLKKLRHRGRNKNKRKQDKLKDTDKMSDTSRSTFDLTDPGLSFNPARRHSCFPAFIDVDSEKVRRGSYFDIRAINARRATCQEGSPRKGRRSSYTSRGSIGSTSSAEMHRVRRLVEIAQLDRYIEHLKKSVDNNNISYIPNRLCCAQLLKSVLQRREREYMYEYLHSNRCSSESDVSMKSREADSKSISKRDGDATDDSNIDHQQDECLKKNLALCLNDNESQEVVPKQRDAKPCDNSQDFSQEEDVPEERVPGALLKAYDSDGTQYSGESDSDPEDCRKHRKRSNSKSRRRSVALYPQNFEIF